MRCAGWVSVFVILMATAGVVRPARAADEVPPTGVIAIDEQLRALRKAGEPVDVADLKSWRTLPPDDDAARVLVAAAAKLDADRLDGEAGRLVERNVRDLKDPLPVDVLNQIRRLVEHRRAVLELLGTLPDTAGCDWGDPPHGPLALHEAEAPFRFYVGMMSRLCFLDGVLAVYDGDLARAARRVRSLHVISDGTSRHPDATISVLHRFAAALAADLLARVAAAEPFDVAALGGQDGARKLIAHALDPATTRDPFVRELRAHRVAVIDAIARVESGTLAPTKMSGSGYGVGQFAGGRVGVPMWPAAVELMTGVIDTASRDLSQSTGREGLQRVYESYAKRGFVPRHVTAMLAPNLTARYEASTNLRAVETLAGVALAVGWYRAEHVGKLPATLGELVPKYLPAEPNDPSATQRAPIRYRADGAVPILWAAGDNGVDDGGGEPVKAVALRDQMAHADLVVHLRPRTRR